MHSILTHTPGEDFRQHGYAVRIAQDRGTDEGIDRKKSVPANLRAELADKGEGGHQARSRPQVSLPFYLCQPGISRGIKSLRERGRAVIATLVGVSLVATVTVIWYGRRIAARIRTWGEKMDEMDAIFKSAATPEEMTAYAVPAQNGPVSQAASSSRIVIGLPRSS